MNPVDIMADTSQLPMEEQTIALMSVTLPDNVAGQANVDSNDDDVCSAPCSGRVRKVGRRVLVRA